MNLWSLHDRVPISYDLKFNSLVKANKKIERDKPKQQENVTAANWINGFQSKSLSWIRLK